MAHKEIELFTDCCKSWVRITKNEQGTFLLTVKDSATGTPYIFEHQIHTSNIEDFSVMLADLVRTAADDYVPEEDI